MGVLRLGAERGQSVVEYALVILLVAIAIVAALSAFGGGLLGLLRYIVHAVPF